MNSVIMSMLLVAGAIHVLPSTGVLGASHLASLYDVTIEDPNLLIMMRHRAVLFTLLGLLLIYAAFKPSLQTLAIFGGLVSASAFLWLAMTAPEYNSNLTRVVYADIVAIVALLIAVTVKWFGPST